MLHPPLALVLSPAWPTLNPVDPVTRSFARVVLTAALTPLIVLVMFLRIWTRSKITKSFGWDDTLIAFALIPTFVFNAIIVAIDIHFYGRYHSYDVPLATDTGNLQIFLASQLIFVLSESLIKFSLLCFYQRLLGSTGSFHFKAAILAAFVFVGGLTISSFFGTLFSCVPVKASFDVFPMYDYTCVSDWMRVVLGILNLVADVLVLVLPIPIVWLLQMPQSQRLMVIGIFSTSALTCIAGAIKVYYSSRIAVSYDLGWEGYGEGFASMLELNLGIMCASAPALKPLVKHYWPGAMKTYEDQPTAQSGRGPMIEMSKGTKIQSRKNSIDKILEEGELNLTRSVASSSGDEGSIGQAISAREYHTAHEYRTMI